MEEATPVVVLLLKTAAAVVVVVVVIPTTALAPRTKEQTERMATHNSTNKFNSPAKVRQRSRRKQDGGPARVPRIVSSSNRLETDAE